MGIHIKAGAIVQAAVIENESTSYDQSESSVRQFLAFSKCRYPEEKALQCYL